MPMRLMMVLERSGYCRRAALPDGERRDAVKAEFVVAVYFVMLRRKLAIHRARDVAGSQLRRGNAGAAYLGLRRAEIVFEGMHRGTDLGGDQQPDQDQVGRQAGFK